MFETGYVGIGWQHLHPHTMMMDALFNVLYFVHCLPLLLAEAPTINACQHSFETWSQTVVAGPACLWAQRPALLLPNQVTSLRRCAYAAFLCRMPSSSSEGLRACTIMLGRPPRVRTVMQSTMQPAW